MYVVVAVDFIVVVDDDDDFHLIKEKRKNGEYISKL